MEMFLWTCFVLSTQVFLLPVTIYLSVKMGRFGYLQGEFQFQDYVKEKYKKKINDSDYV